MGYRIRLKKATFPQKIHPGKSFQIETAWQNAGVAPCYPGGYPCFTLKDDKGGIVSTLVDDKLNMKTLEVSTPEAAPEKGITSKFIVASQFKDPCGTFQRNIQTGKMDLYVSVGTIDGTPTLELPLNECDGQKRYKIGVITIEG